MCATIAGAQARYATQQLLLLLLLLLLLVLAIVPLVLGVVNKLRFFPVDARAGQLQALTASLVQSGQVERRMVCAFVHVTLAQLAPRGSISPTMRRAMQPQHHTGLLPALLRCAIVVTRLGSPSKASRVGAVNGPP